MLAVPKDGDGYTLSLPCTICGESLSLEEAW